MIRRRWTRWALAAALCLPPAAAGAAEEPSREVVEEILSILRDRGIVKEDEYRELATRYAASQQSLESRLPRLQFFGDLRLRHESFWFDEDELGVDKANRFRGRYRLRVGAQARVNDRASVVVRLATGADRDSTNQTLGDGTSGGFFDPDGVFVDQAYADLRPLGREPFAGGSLRLQAGKVPNPYLQKVGKDFLLWDSDIILEGATLRATARANEATGLYANTGYYLLEENSSAKDPHLFAVQAGFTSRLADALEAGARASAFIFDSLNGSVNGMGVFCPDPGDPTSTSFRDEKGEPFLCRAASQGNLLGGLTGDPLGGEMSAGEVRGFVTWSGSERWPVTIYGTLARNFDAASTPGAGEEDTAWGVGIEVGQSSAFVKLGFGYFSIEANAFPALFIDSDLFDGKTNREGFVAYGARRVWRNTDFQLTLFVSDEIESGPAFSTSVKNAERYRLQTDLVLKF